MTFHHSRYGAVDPLNPEAAARCDRGGEIRKRSELQREMIWAGNRLVWNGCLVCAQHIDPPNPQDRIYHFQADPMPVKEPRPDIDAPAPIEPVDGEVLLTDDLLWITTDDGEGIVT